MARKKYVYKLIYKNGYYNLYKYDKSIFTSASFYSVYTTLKNLQIDFYQVRLTIPNLGVFIRDYASFDESVKI